MINALNRLEAVIGRNELEPIKPPPKQMVRF